MIIPTVNYLIDHFMSASFIALDLNITVYNVFSFRKGQGHVPDSPAGYVSQLDTSCLEQLDDIIKDPIGALHTSNLTAFL